MGAGGKESSSFLFWFAQKIAEANSLLLALALESMVVISAKLITVCLIVVLAVQLLLTNDDFEPQNFVLNTNSGNVWLPEQMNAGGHVYPYMATMVTMTCLLVVVLMIVCFAGELTQ